MFNFSFPGPTKRKNMWIIAAIVLLTILGIFAILGAFLGYRRYSKEQGGIFVNSHSVLFKIFNSLLISVCSCSDGSSGYS